jgi:hypothetical protein
MDPSIFSFFGGLLGGAVVALTFVLTVVLRTRHRPPKAIPVLTKRKHRSTAPVRRRRASPLTDSGGNAISFARARRKAKSKTADAIVEPSQTPNIAPTTTTSFDTCPSCGLQAPGSLLAEHFLGSPSHKSGPPKIVKVDDAKGEVIKEDKEDDSNQSVRNLLQMLVPPRAFGRRHAHRSVSPISSIVKELGPPHRHYP